MRDINFALFLVLILGGRFEFMFYMIYGKCSLLWIIINLNGKIIVSLVLE